ncbi:MAG: DUF4160 domain-containing protein [Verrucomicrobiales bacterium]|nr:DUF4160 domain-containing protein [Verrucomicrobiales bacterium]
MPVIANFCGIIIRLLNLRPLGQRLHAFHGDEELVVDLYDLRVLSGHFPEPLGRMVLDWARSHRYEILAGLHRLEAQGRPVLV